MSNKFIVHTHVYLYDDGHHHSSDEYDEFDTLADAQQFISGLQSTPERDIVHARVVDALPPPSGRRTRSTVEPTF